MEYVKKDFGHSNRRACSLVGLWRSTQAYKVKDLRKDDSIKLRMRQLAQENPKWGCPMIHDVLKREGLVVNIKRTERIYIVKKNCHCEKDRADAKLVILGLNCQKQVIRMNA